MPTYNIKFSLLYPEGNRTFRKDTKEEVVIERNHAFAQLYILNKYMKKSKCEVKIITTEPVLTTIDFHGINQIH